MLLTIKEKNTKEAGGTFGGDEYIYGIDSDDGFTGIYLSPNTSRCIH